MKSPTLSERFLLIVLLVLFVLLVVHVSGKAQGTEPKVPAAPRSGRPCLIWAASRASRSFMPWPTPQGITWSV